MHRLKKYQDPAGNLLAMIPGTLPTDQPRMLTPITPKLNPNTQANPSAWAQRQSNRAKFQEGLSNLNEKIGGFTSSGVGSIINGGISAITAGLSAATPQRENSLYGAEQAIAGTVTQMPGIVGLIGKGMQLNSAIGNALGTSINSVNKDQAKKAGISNFERIANNTLGTVANLANPMMGAFNSLRENVEFAGASLDTEKLRGGYTGTLDEMDTAAGMGSNLLFGRNKANKFKQEAVDRNKILTNLSLDQNDRISSVPQTANMYANQTFNKLYNTNTNVSVGRSGLRLLSKAELAKIYSSSVGVPKFQNGGSIMIPDGALHAHKHHMEDTNPDLAEDLTKKGIPIVITDSNGNVEQCAEIEREEITLSTDLTKQIEELWKIGDEESMIKAGKLITDALFNDCIDNAGLIDKVK